MRENIIRMKNNARILHDICSNFFWGGGWGGGGDVGPLPIPSPHPTPSVSFAYDLDFAFFYLRHNVFILINYLLSVKAFNASDEGDDDDMTN